MKYSKGLNLLSTLFYNFFDFFIKLIIIKLDIIPGTIPAKPYITIDRGTNNG